MITIRNSAWQSKYVGTNLHPVVSFYSLLSLPTTLKMKEIKSK